MSDPLAQLLDRFTRRERRALAEILSRLERGEQLPAPPKPERSTCVVGLTGAGGAGKSTFLGALVGHLRGQGLSAAVLACDPQSPLTGGALLGDRIRVSMDPADEGVYFRSMSTRGAAGGISAAVGPALPWLKAFGFDVVLVETVGAGQDQAAVRDVVDRLVLIVTPQMGDAVQWEKAGLLELADLVVVNKSDLAGAERTRDELRHALHLTPMAKPTPVLLARATTGDGVPEVWQTIVDMTTHARGG